MQKTVCRPKLFYVKIVTAICQVLDLARTSLLTNNINLLIVVIFLPQCSIEFEY